MSDSKHLAANVFLALVLVLSPYAHPGQGAVASSGCENPNVNNSPLNTCRTMQVNSSVRGQTAAGKPIGTDA